MHKPNGCGLYNPFYSNSWLKFVHNQTLVESIVSSKSPVLGGGQAWLSSLRQGLGKWHPYQRHTVWTTPQKTPHWFPPFVRLTSLFWKHPLIFCASKCFSQTSNCEFPAIEVSWRMATIREIFLVSNKDQKVKSCILETRSSERLPLTAVLGRNQVFYFEFWREGSTWEASSPWSTYSSGSSSPH